MDLSVVIVNWNTRDYLRACLASLRSAAGGSSQVIVVDNASKDGSATMLQEEFPEVTLIANAENRGYAEGNNQGLAAATGAFLLLLNPDTEVPPGALEAMMAFLRERPAVGAAAPRLVHANGRIQELVRGFPTPRALMEEALRPLLARRFLGARWLATALRRTGPPEPDGPFGLTTNPAAGRRTKDGSQEVAAASVLDARYRVRVADVTAPMPVAQPMASCFMMRREALAQVGPMDEQFPIFFNDVDLCYRLWEAGWEIYYLPNVQVLHHGGAATGQVRPEMIRESHRSLRRFYAKHFRRRLPAPLYAAFLGGIDLIGALRYVRARRRSRQRRGAPPPAGA